MAIRAGAAMAGLAALMLLPPASPALAGGPQGLDITKQVPVAPGPHGPDVTKPYYYQPPPSHLNTLDQLQLKAYRDQLYFQQQNLQLKQSSKLLNPEQQRILNQTQQESGRINSLLAPSLTTPLPSPPVGTTVGPAQIVPMH